MNNMSDTVGTTDRPASRPFVPTDEQRHNDAMLKAMHDAGYTEQQVIDVLAAEVNRLQKEELARNMKSFLPIKNTKL